MTLEAYDGRKLKGFVYVSKTEVTGEKDPSSRYLGVLIKGNFPNFSIFRETYPEILDSDSIKISLHFIVIIKKIIETISPINATHHPPTQPLQPSWMIGNP